MIVFNGIATVNGCIGRTLCYKGYKAQALSFGSTYLSLNVDLAYKAILLLNKCKNEERAYQ